MEDYLAISLDLVDTAEVELARDYASLVRCLHVLITHHNLESELIDW